MGRPDTLGADLYHNRSFPLIGNDNSGSMPDDHYDPPQCAIIKSMVDLSRITRSICLDIYLPETITPRTVALAYRLEQDLDKWVEGLPDAIRPKQATGEPVSLNIVGISDGRVSRSETASTASFDDILPRGLVT